MIAFILDSPKRAEVKECTFHGGTYCCDYCERAAQPYNPAHPNVDKDDMDAKGNMRIFPGAGIGRMRTEKEWRRAAAKAEPLTKPQKKALQHDLKGVQGESPLLKLENGFNITTCVPTEAMHVLGQGLNKRMLK